MSEKNILPKYQEVPQSDVGEVEKLKPKLTKKVVILGVAAIVLINILGSMHFAAPCGQHLQPFDGPAPPPGRFHHGGFSHPEHHMNEDAKSDSDSDSDDEAEHHEFNPQHHPRPKGVKFKGDELHDTPKGNKEHEEKPHHEGKGPHHKGKGPHHKGKGPHHKGKGPHHKGKGPHDPKNEESMGEEKSEESNDDLNSVDDSSKIVAVETVHLEHEEKPHHKGKGPHNEGKGPHHKGKRPHHKGKEPHDPKNEESMGEEKSEESNDDLNSVNDSSEFVAVEAVHLKSEEKAELSNLKLADLPSAEDVQDDSN